LVDIALLRLSEGLELDLKPVQGEKDVYRIRVGRYRVLFTKFNKTVLVFRISPRGDVYK
jgi:mRNA interferase RelE/StbE